MRKAILIILGLVIAAGYLVFSLSRGLKSSPLSAKIQVTASFYPLYFFTSQIAGHKAEVYNITPAGAEPHDYEPTTQDLARIEDSRLLVLNGGQLEAWGDRVKNAFRQGGPAVISVGTNLISQQDPHVWLSPLLAKQETSAIAEELVKIDPVNASYYQTNAVELARRLEALDQKYRESLAHCQKKDIVASHAAFGYLASEYGFSQAAIAGLSPDEEPSPRKLIEVADFAKKNHIQYIFFESLVSPKLAETIAREIGIQTLILNPLEGLSDEEINLGHSYFTVMEQNLANLKIALSCQ